MAKKSMDADVLILGAGAAGLAAAGHLSGHGKKVLVIEARNRIGGRVFTHREPGMSYPIELGAEFVHGDPDESLEEFGASQLSIFPSDDTRFLQTPKGELREMPGYWDMIAKVLSQLDCDRREDRSFVQFLKAHEKSIDPSAAFRATQFVEGFHGAPAAQISEKGLAASEQGTETNEGPKVFRIFEGYDTVLERLKSRIPCPDERILLNRVASELRLEKDAVEVRVRSRTGSHEETYRASRVIVTLPIGVLKSAFGDEGHLRITPMPKKLHEALEGVEMGTATRLVFRFRTRVWEKKLKRPIGFLHASDPESPFPVWWTASPVRVPVITAWAGGPSSQRYSGKSESQLVDLALATLSDLISVDKAELQRELQDCFRHDWLNDPYSRGAYSFIRVGGADRAKRLEEKFGETLYLAGEGTHSGAERGTVDGAVATGLRAATQLLEDEGAPHDYV